MVERGEFGTPHEAQGAEELCGTSRRVKNLDGLRDAVRGIYDKAS